MGRERFNCFKDLPHRASIVALNTEEKIWDLTQQMYVLAAPESITG